MYAIIVDTHPPISVKIVKFRLVIHTIIAIMDVKKNLYSFQQDHYHHHHLIHLKILYQIVNKKLYKRLRIINI